MVIYRTTGHPDGEPRHRLDEFGEYYLRCKCGFECKSLDELIIHYNNPERSKTTTLRNIQQPETEESIIAANKKSLSLKQLAGIARLRMKDVTGRYL